LAVCGFAGAGSNRRLVPGHSGHEKATNWIFNNSVIQLISALCPSGRSHSFFSGRPGFKSWSAHISRASQYAGDAS
jgi:hypothetical protein